VGTPGSTSGGFVESTLIFGHQPTDVNSTIYQRWLTSCAHWNKN